MAPSLQGAHAAQGAVIPNRLLKNFRRLSKKAHDPSSMGVRGGDSSAGCAGAILGEVRKGGAPPSEESLRRRWAFFISLLTAVEGEDQRPGTPLGPDPHRLAV